MGDKFFVFHNLKIIQDESLWFYLNYLRKTCQSWYEIIKHLVVLFQVFDIG
jgi:hypothetical protein